MSDMKKTIAMYTCSLIIILIATPVCNSETGCSINGTFIPCETNFKLMESGKCEACDAGSYGCNCSLVCPNNTFGEGCYSTCNCAADEICDPTSGCTSNTNISQYTTDMFADSSDFPRSTPVRSIQDSPKNNNMHKLPLSLLVSSAVVVFFSILCAAILIRLNKRVYKREYKKLVNNLHMTETRRNEDETEYTAYNYTDSSIFSNSIRHNNEENAYDHSDRGSYNILSLRSRQSMVNGYEDECAMASCSFPHSFSNIPKPKAEEMNVEIEPECFINLFQEDERQKVIYSKWEKETNSESPNPSIIRPKSSMW